MLEIVIQNWEDLQKAVFDDVWDCLLYTSCRRGRRKGESAAAFPWAGKGQNLSLIHI